MDINYDTDFVDINCARLLKDLKFDKACLRYVNERNPEPSYLFDHNFTHRNNTELASKIHHGYITLPLWQQVRQWLYEAHGIEVSFGHTKKAIQKFTYIIHYNTFSSKVTVSEEEFISPILAENAGARRAVSDLYNNLSNEQ